MKSLSGRQPHGRKIFFAPLARGNLQVHWPEGNEIIRRGIYDSVGGVPDYNAQARVEKI